jgi:hypothetical protein
MINMKKHKFVEPFIQFVRDSKEFEFSINKRPSAFVLLSLIAQRARRTNENIQDGLEIGEALIGDYKTYQATEQTYRTDKKYLEKLHFPTFRSMPQPTTNFNAQEAYQESRRKT